MSSSEPWWPLTAPQYGMWAGQQLDPHSPSFWTAEAIELEGDIDRARLEAAMTATLAECDALHMRYRSDGRAVMQMRAPAQVDLRLLDFSLSGDAWSNAWAWMLAELQASPDLGGGPLFGTALLRLGPRRHLWFLRAHHIALDGFGYLLLIHRVAQRYSSRGEALAPARWSLQPVIEEEARYRGSEQHARDRDFWREELASLGAPPTLAPPTAPDDRSRTQRCQLPLSTYAQWQAAARGCGVDWSAWLLAAVAAWMHARSGADDISLGLLVMNRLGSAALGVPCMAMNVVPLRLRVTPLLSFSALAHEAAATLRRLRPHQRYNYEWLREDFGLEGGHRQLYGPVVNLMPFDRGFVFDGVASRAHPVSAGSVEDLDLTISPLVDGLRFDIEANPRAYDDATLRGHHAALLAMIAAAMARPDASMATLATQVVIEGTA